MLELVDSLDELRAAVEDPSELEDVYSEALKQNKPVLVDVIIDADIYPEPRRKDAVKQRG